VSLVGQPPDPSAEQGGDSFSDKLTIQTPEQTLVEFHLAGIGSRFLACSIDTLILVLASIVLTLFALVVAAVAGSSISWGSTWVLAVMVFLLFALFYGYFAIFEAIWNGQTPGKRLMQLRVIQQSGRPISVFQAIARNLLRAVDQLPTPLYAVGCVTALLNRQNKRLGDFVAGTVVVRERSLEEVRPDWGTAPVQPQAQSAPSFNLRLLGDAEFQLIEAFVQRRSYLEASIRQRMAYEIVQKIAGKLGLTPQELAAASTGGRETFLEVLLQQYRSTGHLHS
jgi:uncharacterized RDD family membrane protein YckC